MASASDWTPEQIVTWERLHAIGRTTFLIRTALRRGFIAGLGLLIAYIVGAYLFVDTQFFPIWSIIWNTQTFPLGLLLVIGFTGIAYLGATGQWKRNEEIFQQVGGNLIAHER
jgi:hypothetical protein